MFRHSRGYSGLLTCQPELTSVVFADTSEATISLPHENRFRSRLSTCATSTSASTYDKTAEAKMQDRQRAGGQTN